MTEFNWVRQLRTIRDAAVRAGLPTVVRGKTNVQAVVLAVNTYIRKHARYTEDKSVRWQSVRTLSPRWSDEMWASWALPLVREQRLEDDCDAYSWTAIVLCLALGVPPERLAFGIVRSETARHYNDPRPDHAIGIWLDDQGVLRTLGDTWDQASSRYSVPVSTRHDLVYIYRMIAGRFEENASWFATLPKQYRTATGDAKFNPKRGRPL